MKTFARLIRRYVFAAVGLGLLLPTVTRGPWRWMMTETCFGTITCPIC